MGMSIPSSAVRIISDPADRASFPVTLLGSLYESVLIANKPDMDGPALSEPDPIYKAVSGAYGAVTDRLGFSKNPSHLRNFFKKRNSPPLPAGGSRKKKRTVKRKRTRTQRRR